jgi:hypothetical protein
LDHTGDLNTAPFLRNDGIVLSFRFYPRCIYFAAECPWTQELIHSDELTKRSEPDARFGKESGPEAIAVGSEAFLKEIASGNKRRMEDAWH